MDQRQDKLGRVMTAEEIALYLVLEVKTVRLYYNELGGIRLGRRLLFLEGGKVAQKEKAVSGAVYS